MQSNYQHNINNALKELHDTKSISSALLVCNNILEYMGIETKSVEDIELSKLKLPNAERYDRWFDAHPHFRGDRACFDLAPEDTMLEAKFFALQKRSKLFIAGAVNFTPNFEDRDYTRNDPNMKVGIDFFFTPEKDSVIVVLSNKGSLRLVELSNRLTNTQNEIFTIWHNVAKTEGKNAFHMTMWESFKLSSLNKKFYEGIANSFLSLTQHLHQNDVEEQLANQFANRLHGRLLFLWFLRKKNIINESKEYFTIGDKDDTTYYANTLSALFFNVLNNEEHKDFDPITPYLNGGLFDQNSDGEYWNAHKPTFPTGFFRTLYDHFDSFNFTTDESTPEYEQIAIDPEMLGRIFESFLATLTTETGAQAKKANGAFYTPREIVSYMSRESLRQYLYTALDAGTTLKTSIDDLLDRPDSEWALAGTNSKRDAVSKEDKERILEVLRNIKVLDPAVGSGAFPMGVLHKILSLFERLEPNFDSYETKLSILKNNIYGVDIDPTAIEISRLRAWLSIIVDVKDIKKIKPLPNLDFKFVCANSLIGLEKGEVSFSTDENLKPELIRIRDEYYATSSKTKKEKLQKEYTKLTHKDGLFDTTETRQLKSYKPFENGKSASFYDPELMHGVEAFNVVIGNPPYGFRTVLSKEEKEYFRKVEKIEFSSGDSAEIFCKKSFDNLVKQGGTLTFIIPKKSLYGDAWDGFRTNYWMKYCVNFLLDSSKAFDEVLLEASAFSMSKKSSGELIKCAYLSKTGVVEFAQGKKHEIFLENNTAQIYKLLISNEFWNKIQNEKIKEQLVEGRLGLAIGTDFFSDEKTEHKLLKGIDIGKWNIKSNRWLKNVSNLKWSSAEAFLKPKVVSQVIVAHIENPTPHLKITASYDSEGIIITNTLMSFDINEKINPKFWMAYLNSQFVSWYAFNFIYARAIRTMHFYNFYIQQIPIPKAILISGSQDKIVSLVDQILSIKKADSKSDIKDLENQIDTLIYKLYNLNEEEIKVIEGQK